MKFLLNFGRFLVNFGEFLVKFEVSFAELESNFAEFYLVENFSLCLKLSLYCLKFYSI